uniref:MORF/ORRM1/DAG-like MORF domain-containing protein n=1 Tax=Cucumis melo TaxID=3656 RepID=A0A9I9ECB9_CUCME
MSVRDFSTSDPKPKYSNDPPTFSDYGCDFEHWLVVMDLPRAKLTRDEMINIYIKTLAMVVGRYIDIENKNYRGEPFINGQAVPYDLKYHQQYYKRINRLDRPCEACKLLFGGIELSHIRLWSDSEELD